MYDVAKRSESSSNCHQAHQAWKRPPFEKARTREREEFPSSQKQSYTNRGGQVVWCYHPVPCDHYPRPPLCASRTHGTFSDSGTILGLGACFVRAMDGWILQDRRLGFGECWVAFDSVSPGVSCALWVANVLFFIIIHMYLDWGGLS